MVDTRPPQWLHPISLLFDLLSSMRNHLVPLVIAIYSIAKGGFFGLIFAAGLFSISMLYAIIKYTTLRYQLRDGDFIVDEGLIFRRHRTVPVQKIQNIDLVQNVFHRFFRVAEVRIETASGTEPEAILRVLSLEEVENLRSQIFADRRLHSASTDAQSTASELTESQETVPLNLSDGKTFQNERVLVHSISPWLLFKAGLISNRGTVLIAFLIGAFYQTGFEKRVPFKVSSAQIQKYIPRFWDGSNGLTIFLSVVLGILGLALMLRVLSIAWHFIRFYGYRLEEVGSDLRISCGLFTKVSATVPISRIQFISIHRNLFGKWLGIGAIRIETAGGGATENENAATTISRRWFIPVIREKEIPSILNRLRPGLIWEENAFVWKPLSPLAKNRKRRLATMLAIIAGVVAFWFWSYWGILVGATIGSLGWWYAAKKAKSMRYARNEQGIVYRSGLFYKKCSITFPDRIQNVALRHSPFDRKWKMATLEIDTAAAGPADHRMHISMLDASFAEQEYRAIASQVALCSDETAA